MCTYSCVGPGDLTVGTFPWSGAHAIAIPATASPMTAAAALLDTEILV
jgi:hypothetical protein